MWEASREHVKPRIRHRKFTLPTLLGLVDAQVMSSAMKNRIITPALTLALLGAVHPLHATLTIDYAGQIALPGGGEIISYTSDNFTLATTFYTGTGSGNTQGVNLYNFNGGSSSFRATADFSSLFGQANTASVSSVALDPLGRGFGVATVIPTASTSTFSKLAFFDYNTGSVLHNIDVGYHADSVRFSDDGARIVVANEGEARSNGTDAAGSLSVLSLSGISSAAQVTSITAPVTTDFSAGNFASGASLSGIRNPYIAPVGAPGASGTFISTVPNFADPANINPAGIEPEYAVVSGNKVYVSLQENNAIGVLDLATNKWEKIHNLGTITQTIDASDRDGPGGTALAQINDTVKGLPMPDTIAVVTIAGTRYIVTANEGDARIDDRDISRFGDTNGADSTTPVLDTNYPTTATGVRADGVLGRLHISRIDGDTDGDGKIDDIRMIGTRSFSIWNAETGALVADSGNLEAQLLALDPTRHNINREGTAIDNRSDDKGPEPEALAVFTKDGSTYAAVGLERQNGILLYDITNPTAPLFVDYVNGAVNGLISPESLFYIAAEHSPTGIAYLLAGFEGVDGSGAQAGIGIYTATAAIPEPSTYALLAGLLALGMVAWRRHSKRRA
jgi:hypothetical protein